MNTVTHLRYRGDYYEITFTPSGDIVDILVFTQHGHRPETVLFWTLDEIVRHKIDDTVSYALNHSND